MVPTSYLEILSREDSGNAVFEINYESVHVTWHPNTTLEPVYVYRQAVKAHALS